jgi:predicted nucleic acid-binding protein
VSRTRNSRPKSASHPRFWPGAPPLLPKGKRRTRLEHWFQQGVERIHCLAWDASTGLRWAQLLADLRARGRSMPIKDSLIAATALTHGIPVVTRNRRDFAGAGVEVVDPFA